MSICENCFKSRIEKTGSGATIAVCTVDEGIHVGMMICDKRVGREEVKERAAAIRRFVAEASDEQLINMYC